MSNANIVHVQSLYAAFGRGDIATLLAGCAADIDWETVGRPFKFATRDRGSMDTDKHFAGPWPWRVYPLIDKA